MSAMIFTISTYAQIGVGQNVVVRSETDKFSEEAINKLKASKTVFIYRDSDNIEELENAIKEVWNFTEISFQPFSKMKGIKLDDNISIFSIEGLNTHVEFGNHGMSYDNTHIYLSLWMLKENKKGKKVRESYCRIELHPSGIDYYNILTVRKEDALEYIYEEGQLKNWTAGFLKNYLKYVNDALTKKSERWLFLSDETNPELKNLKTDTLYIPEYTLTKFNKFTGDESKKLDEEELFKPYNFNYKIINTADLSKKIIESKEPFYYMVYIKSSTDKYINIYNSKSGTLIYRKYSPVSYNMKDKDFKALNSIINRIADKR